MKMFKISLPNSVGAWVIKNAAAVGASGDEAADEFLDAITVRWMPELLYRIATCCEKAALERLSRCGLIHLYTLASKLFVVEPEHVGWLQDIGTVAGTLGIEVRPLHSEL